MLAEFVVRRLAEHHKGPVLALGILVGAVFGLLKTFAP